MPKMSSRIGLRFAAEDGQPWQPARPRAPRGNGQLGHFLDVSSLLSAPTQPFCCCSGLRDWPTGNLATFWQKVAKLPVRRSCRAEATIFFNLTGTDYRTPPR